MTSASTGPCASSWPPTFTISILLNQPGQLYNAFKTLTPEAALLRGATLVAAAIPAVFIQGQLADGAIQLASTLRAFAPVKSSGVVVTWGDGNSGGSSGSISDQP